MNVRKKGLGRGLDALLGGLNDRDTGANDLADPAEDALDTGESRGSLTSLPLDLIERGRFQPRRDFDPEGLRELADSIAAQGVIQPIVVRTLRGGRYEILAGERRWRASQQAGLSEIPVVIREADDQSAMAIALIENIQRADLNPLEEASALQRLLGEFGLTHAQIAEAIGRSRASVTNLLRLLELNDDVKRALERGQLEMGHARALLGIKGPRQSAAATQVTSRGLSVRETERLVRQMQQEEEGRAPPVTRPAAVDPDVRRLQDDLADRLGAQVQIQPGNRGGGRLVIAYHSLDELDGILAHIK
ncbi:MAG: ParB/RepB/Spo0J family partition protein [Chromatiaceae bacterium]|nr:ParB/RepB/Spo0J family partition protein [Chromatiaceae bacterium]MBP9604069.1 ParB/RepB/Spo0J family partition protein [Chromatiaceae bacterium]